jgi:hypothetical protein
MQTEPRPRPSPARRLTAALLALSLWSGCAGGRTVAPDAPFDAAAAFDEFERTLREYYAYLARPDFAVDEYLARVRAVAVRARDAAELRRLLHRSTFAFADPHLLVGPLDDTDPNVIWTSADLALTLHGDRFVVADVRAGSAADTAGVRPGWQVRAVDGEPIEDRVAALLTDLLPAPLARQRAYAATLAVNGRRAGARTVEFLVGGEPRTLGLANPRELAKQVAELPPLTLDERDGVAIVRFNNSLGEQETIAAFDAAIHRYADRRALILDLRNTPSGGNTDIARAIIGHFIAETRPYQVHEIPAIERRTTVPRRFIELALPRAPRFAGRVAVLGGRWTGSMGEGLLIGLHAAAGARTFASDLGDLLGALHVQELPSIRATLELGAEALFHVDGTPRGDYVADVPLAAADRDAEGGDPALRAALAWLAAP